MKKKKKKEKRGKKGKKEKKERKNRKKRGKKVPKRQINMDHLRMYTFALRILGPRMCGFLGSIVPFLDVIIPLGIRGAAL